MNRHRVGELVADVLFPRRCAGCGRRGAWVCSECRDTVRPILDISCPRCGVPMLAGRCACGSLHPGIERAIAPYPYAGWVAEAIKCLKYENESARADHLGEELIAAFGRLGAVEGLVPVPLHPRKLRDRGYNQSELLARTVSRITGIPVTPMIQRTRHTTAQMTLGAADRQRNMAQAFAPIPGAAPVAGGCYVLLDDVRTTGATVGACAEAMQAVGVDRVMVVTLTIDLDRERVAALQRMGLLGEIPDQA